MKNVIKILSAVLLVTAINACTLQEDPDPTNSGGAINVIGQTVQEQAVTNLPGTKTTLEEVVDGGETRWETHWVADSDLIGMFSPQAKATQEGTPAANPAKNLAFSAQASAKNSAFAGTMYWGNNESHSFCAYYPYNSAYEGDQTAVPISLPSSQTQSLAGNTAHIGALDYMVATPATVAYGGAVSLTFKHVFSMIEFQVKGSGDLTQVSLSGANSLACTGTIDLTQTPTEGTPYTITTSSTSKYVTVTLGSAASLNSTTAISVYMMVRPGSQSKNLQIGLKIGESWTDMSKAQPTGGFVRGKKYVVTLNTADAEWNAAFKDNRDDKTYPYITIGTQVWMTENLAFLPEVDGSGTGSTSTAHYYVYGYDGTDVTTAKATSNYTTYGVLYNFPSALTACPDGWHLPSDAEWTTLTTYLGGESVAGNKMKEAGTSHWTSPNIGATNSSGFTALPGGYRLYDGAFYDIGYSGHWWSSTQYDTSNAWVRSLFYSGSNVLRSYSDKEVGFSVRCVRD